MATKTEDNKNKSKNAFRQIKLVVPIKERQWNRKKVKDQLLFIACSACLFIAYLLIVY